MRVVLSGPQLWPYDNPEQVATCKPLGRYCTGITFGADQKRCAPVPWHRAGWICRASSTH
eukprot:5063458-Pyramimonas_sp.AAC.1